MNFLGGVIGFVGLVVVCLVEHFEGRRKKK